MNLKPQTLITILGPTATGKTALAAGLASVINGEVISADSRQVYRGMDIGTGKDYDDYKVGGITIPFHLIDIAEPGYEYNIFEYQKDFHRVYDDITGRGKTPVLCGGSGMYLEAVLKGYQLIKASVDIELQAALEQLTNEQLIGLLKSYKPLHNKTDIEDRQRILKALLISRNVMPDEETRKVKKYPVVNSLIFGISLPRELVKARITERLKNRLETGMIAEVEKLLAGGISPERLIQYGLEYKFITLYLTGKTSYAELFENLNIAIRQFAKRQMTWFRRMERQGFTIHWIDGRLPVKQKIEIILHSTGISERN